MSQVDPIEIITQISSTKIYYFKLDKNFKLDDTEIITQTVKPVNQYVNLLRYIPLLKLGLSKIVDTFFSYNGQIYGITVDYEMIIFQLGEYKEFKIPFSLHESLVPVHQMSVAEINTIVRIKDNYLAIGFRQRKMVKIWLVQSLLQNNLPDKPQPAADQGSCFFQLAEAEQLVDLELLQDGIALVKKNEISKASYVDYFHYPLIGAEGNKPGEFVSRQFLQIQDQIDLKYMQDLQRITKL